MASTSKASETELPEENRTRLCEEFASVAGTDSAVAQCYLAENEWEMEVQTPAAECAFYQPPGRKRDLTAIT